MWILNEIAVEEKPLGLPYVSQDRNKSVAVAEARQASGAASCQSIVCACDDQNFVSDIRDLRFYALYQNDHAQFDGHSDTSLDEAIANAKEDCEQSGLSAADCKLIVTEDIDNPYDGYHQLQ